MPQYHHGNLRDALLAEAVIVIESQGVEGLSLRQIAKTLGVSHAAPARHFRNKSDLLSAVVSQAYKELTQAVLKAAQTSDTDRPVQVLAIMAHTTMTWALANKAKFSVMMNPDVSRFAKDALKSDLRDFTQVLAGAIDAAQLDGFARDIPREVVLLHAMGAALGAAKLMTDDLMRSVLDQSILEIPDNAQLIAQITAQIIPQN